MEERKYLDDVPREIQDMIFDGKFSDAFLAVGKGTNLSADEIDEKYREIAKRLHEKNPNFRSSNPKIEVSARTKGGCLLFVIGFILFCVVVNLSDEAWESQKGIGLTIGAIVAIISGMGLFGVGWADVKKHMTTSSEPKAEKSILPTRSELVTCKTCKKEISQTAPECPHCGEHLPGLKIFCPKCRSTSVQLGQKGYGALKAAAGALILGPGGLLVGLHGRKNMELQCLSCGKKWKPENLK